MDGENAVQRNNNKTIQERSWPAEQPINVANQGDGRCIAWSWSNSFFWSLNRWNRFIAASGPFKITKKTSRRLYTKLRLGLYLLGVGFIHLWLSLWKIIYSALALLNFWPRGGVGERLPRTVSTRKFQNVRIFLLPVYKKFVLLYSTLLHLPPLRFHCADGCWELRTVATGPLAVRCSNHG
jgi:hypothetical protein